VTEDDVSSLAQATPVRTELQQVSALFGGRQTLRRAVQNPLDAHDLLVAGLPGDALLHLLGRLGTLKGSPALEKALGMSLRTIQRRKERPDQVLDREQSSRTWKFAEILARTLEIFGSQDDAEDWLARPAMGLDGRRPIELLETAAGTEIVEEFLTRLEYGVYT
jgi:putative toxin-antitoxin system antitoxin component (TIGR02293 family)